MIFLLISISLATKIVEYRFGYNFGEVFHDFSGNGRDAVNGDSSTTLTSNTISTDRGAYFGTGSYKITLPLNDQVQSSFVLPNSFLIASWIFGFDAYGTLYSRYKDSANQFYVNLNDAFDKYVGRVIIQAIDTGELMTSAYGFTINTWVLSGVVFTMNAMLLYENNSLKKTITFNAPSYTEFGTYSFTIGGPASFSGFIWYFVISSDPSSQSGLISLSTTTTCLTPSCINTFSPTTVIDPYLGSGYLSSEVNWNKNSAGTLCPNLSYGCAASNSLNCICASQSCVIESTSCYCWGTSGLDGICVCGLGFYLVNGDCCETSCLTCNSGSLLCLTCIASNSFADLYQGCNCNNGFYGTKPLTTANACTACFNECQTCQGDFICLTCISSNASPDAVQGCACNTGYYAATALVSSTACVVCYQECNTCNQANLCLTCIAFNAAPTVDLSPGCKCYDGYWGSPLTSANSCTQCYLECATCNIANSCITCIDPNAVPDAITNIGCLCKNGYWGTAPLSTSTSCIQCFSECSSCNQAHICQTCIDPNTSIDPVEGCNCNIRYYGTKPLITTNSCIICYSECETCIQDSLCTSCIASNTYIDLVQGCNCNTGYYGTKPLITASACIACYNECATCTQASLCTSCIAYNTIIDPVQGCNCNAGYYGTKPLITASACIACYNECATCTQASLCTSCIASNTNIDPVQGCNCNTGYYGTKPLVTSSACIVCYNECATCTQASLCISCIASNSSPDSIQGCYCDNGYYGSAPLITLISCITCYSECATCTQSQLCTTCIANNSQPDTSQGCKCDNGYFGTSPLLTINACTVCHIDCATCADAFICLTCIDSEKTPDVIGCKCKEGNCFINGYCFEIPTGYSIVGSTCVLNKDIVFNIILNEITGLVTDLAYNVSGVAGNSEEFYPKYDTEDPYYTHNRGYYFNGVSSIVTFNTPLVISNEFTFEAWFLPTDVNGILFTKQVPITLDTYFAVHLQNSLRVLISNSTAEHNTVYLEVAPVLNEWNYLKYSSRFTGQNFEFLMCLNDLTELAIGSSLISLKDTSLASQLVIGGQMQKDLYYKGFIYELKLFNIYSLRLNAQTCMEPCTSCISTGTCLSNCDITEYWAGYSYNNCSSCSFNCGTGCKDERENCALCDDILCETCEGISNCNQCIDGAIFIENHCECTENFTTSEFSCNICQNGYVYNNICYKCKEKCLECDSKACTKCVNNADLIGKNCVCRLGYSGTDTCEYKLLYVNASVSNDNTVYLDFSMSLSNDLEINDLNLSISNISVLFSLEKYSATRFVLKAELILTKSEILVIQFIKEIVSSENGVLNVTEVKVSVKYTPSEIENPIITAFKNTGELCMAVASSTLVGISMINPSPASLWSFLNNIQMLVYIYLIRINFTHRFTGFLLGLKKQKIFPNIFEYIGIDQGIPHRFTHAADLGFSTNAIMINIGSWFSCFIFFIIIYFILRGISAILSLTRFKESKVNAFLIGKCEGYKYGFFLRLWIQCYIDILISAIITFYDSNLKDLNQAYNLYLGIILSFVATCTPVVAFVVIYKKNQEKKEKETYSGLGLWKSLFSEFKEDSHLSQSYFYTVFFIRRYFYVIILFVLNDYPIIQCCLCEILMLLVFSI